MQAALFRRATEEPLSVSDLVREREIKRRELQAGTIAVPHLEQRIAPRLSLTGPTDATSSLDYARKSRNVGIPASFPNRSDYERPSASCVQYRGAARPKPGLARNFDILSEAVTPTLEESVSRLKQLMNRPYPPIRGSVKNDPINRECPNHPGVHAVSATTDPPADNRFRSRYRTSAAASAPRRVRRTGG